MSSINPSDFNKFNMPEIPKGKEEVEETEESLEEFDFGDDEMEIKDDNTFTEEESLFIANVKQKYVDEFKEFKKESFKDFLLGSEAAAASAAILRRRNKRLELHPETMTLEDKWMLDNIKIKDKHVEKTKTGEIYSEIDAREKDIKAKKDKWRKAIMEKERNAKDPRIKNLYKFLKAEIKNIKPEVGGQGGAYKTDHLYFKPMGEDICEINNHKGNSTAFLEDRVRKTIPLYQGCEREAASFESACASNISEVTPPTVLAIAENEVFSHISDQLPEDEKTKLLNQLKTPIDREKLGSLQQRIEGAVLFQEIEETWGIEGLAQFRLLHPDFDQKYTDADHVEYLKTFVDTSNYEDCNFFLWKIGETDGNRGNFLVKQAKSKHNQTGKYFFIKIDNGLAYPEKNEEFDNKLADLQLGRLRMSDRLKKKIQDISAVDEVKILKSYGLTAAIPATLQRISAMKILIERFPDITIREMNFRLSLLENESAKHVRQGRFKEILRDLTSSEIDSLQIIPSKRLDALSSEEELQKLLKEEASFNGKAELLESDTPTVREKIKSIKEKIELEPKSKNENLSKRKAEVKKTKKI